MRIVPWGQTGAVGQTDKTLLGRKGFWSRNCIYERILKVVEAMKKFISKLKCLTDGVKQIWAFDKIFVSRRLFIVDRHCITLVLFWHP